jgi:hypothetical protein
VGVPPAATAGLAPLGRFGTDWLYVAVPVLAFALVAARLAARTTGAEDDGPLLRFARGAGEVTGLPA